MANTKREEIIHERLAEIPAQQRQGIVDDVVENPYAKGENIRVLRATRDDPLFGMYSRGSIDHAQLSAGREWQRHWEDAQGVSALRGIDPTKEPVDGKGPTPAPFTDKRDHAMLELRQCALLLGWEGDRIVRRVLGEHMQLGTVASLHGRSKKYIGIRFRECLETMAKIWMLA